MPRESGESKNQNRGSSRKGRKQGDVSSASDARTMKDIAELFAGLRFARRIVGGVEERDVWKKLDEVQTAYRKVYEAQHERDLALIEERDKTIRELSASLEQIKKLCGESAAGVEIPKAPAPCQNNGSDVEGTARKPDRNDGSGVKGASREPYLNVKPDVKGACRDYESEVEGSARKLGRENRSELKGASREPDQDGESNIEDAVRRQYRDDKPDVKGVSRKPSRTKGSRETTEASPAMRGSIDSLSSDSSAEADLAFDWLDDGDFNL